MYRKRLCTTRTLIVGVCLWIVRRALGDRPPTLAEYAARHGISPDTIRRAARALLRPVLACLRARRPGPLKKKSDPTHEARIQASLACNDLLKSLLPASLAELANSPHKRGLVAQVAKLWIQRGVPIEALASWLSLSAKTLRRWISRLDDHEVPHKSRRPTSSPRQLPVEIQCALFGLRRAMPDISVAELTRVFVCKFGGLLQRHGRTAVSAKAVARYVAPSREPQGLGVEEDGSPRGGYSYPPPLAMAWIDTTNLEVAGTKVHVVVAMEASSRVGLAGEVFVQDNAATTVEVLGRALARVPQLSAVLRDRGTPYLNSVVNETLGAQDVVPIDAHPYFPIDKAALERFFRWIKEWLMYALAPFEELCRREGRTPTSDEVVARVQPVLRVCLRAYNLLPQPYLEESSPIERIDRLLRSEGDPGFSLSDLRRLAIERETKDDLLKQVRDGLQLDKKSFDTMRADFAKISRIALRRALDAVGHKLFVTRDAKIVRPYGYLLAVAKIKEREHQQSRAHETRRRGDQRERLDRSDAAEEAIRQEEQQRQHNPEEVLPATLRDWVKAMAGHIPAIRRTLGRKLAQILASLQQKLGAAFAPQLEAIWASLPDLAAQIRPADTGFPDRLQPAFADLVELAANALHPGDGLPTRPPSSWHGNQVRGSPPDPPDTHVSGTDVSP